jgi:ABC-2 type transport system ATP-binding protein
VGVIRNGDLVFQGPLAQLQRHEHRRPQIIIETENAATCRNLLPLDLGVATVLAPGTLALPYQSPEQMAYLAQQLVGAGQPLYGLRCQQPSLEETFLHLTKTAQVV